MTDGAAYAISGDPITYTLVVANAGPDAANGALITDTLPGTLNGVAWTCAVSGGSCSTPSGAGNLSTVVDLTRAARSHLPSADGWRSARSVRWSIPPMSRTCDPNPDNNYVTDSDIVLHVKVYLPLVIK